MYRVLRSLQNTCSRRVASFNLQPTVLKQNVASKFGETLSGSQMCCTGGYEPRLENELPRDLSLHQLLRTERSVISRCVTT
jgi:hypothetical protein